MADFAAVAELTGGRSFDPININNKLLRGIFRSLVKQVQAEYVVGYYPNSDGAAEKPRQVAVELLDEKTGKLYGGRRLVVH